MNEPLKPKWYLGRDIVSERGIQGFQLFDLLKAGVQVRTGTGRIVVDSDPLPSGRRHPLEHFEKEKWRLEQINRGKDEAGQVDLRGVV